MSQDEYQPGSGTVQTLFLFFTMSADKQCSPLFEITGFAKLVLSCNVVVVVESTLMEGTEKPAHC